MGDIFLNTDLLASKNLCNYAKDCITQAFDGEVEHEALHKKMHVVDFARHVTLLKNKFTNSEVSKEIIRDFVIEMGLQPRDYIFDVPRVRVVPHYDYLHAGVSYAYKPHRDTWYGSADCQINTWMPVYTIEPDQTMMINPAYFSRAIKNTSTDWSLSDWINTQRPLAEKNITEEQRIHPIPLDEINNESEIRVAANTGEVLIFSAAHLHGTVPNLTDKVRFSVDFRLIHTDDLQKHRGASNVDNGCTDVEAGYSSFFFANNFSRFSGVIS